MKGQRQGESRIRTTLGSVLAVVVAVRTFTALAAAQGQGPEGAIQYRGQAPAPQSTWPTWTKTIPGADRWFISTDFVGATVMDKETGLRLGDDVAHALQLRRRGDDSQELALPPLHDHRRLVRAGRRRSYPAVSHPAGNGKGAGR